MDSGWTGRDARSQAGLLQPLRHAVQLEKRQVLKKYLELAPDGEHAREVRQMLDYLATLAALADSANKTKKN
jgi:hypothetical protein